ncbi:hypothetical protein [Actinomyces procaprae]|uniref:hypothetical protein n=1 Tax=Actinomyces procaprae TaxID=2560010 RepID=UPI0010A22DDD|nr:hypothetical protein [Actinomyces procaprae]
MTTSHDNLTQAFNGIRDSLLAMRDTLNQALGHTAHAQELAADLDDADTVDHSEVTTRTIPAMHLQLGMTYAPNYGTGQHEITGLVFTSHSVRLYLDHGDRHLTCTIDDDVRILDNQQEEDMTPIPTALINRLRDTTPHITVACNSERDELQPMRYAIAEHDTAKAILAAADRDN